MIRQTDIKHKPNIEVRACLTQQKLLSFCLPNILALTPWFKFNSWKSRYHFILRKVTILVTRTVLCPQLNLKIFTPSRNNKEFQHNHQLYHHQVLWFCILRAINLYKVRKCCPSYNKLSFHYRSSAVKWIILCFITFYNGALEMSATLNV